MRHKEFQTFGMVSIACQLFNFYTLFWGKCFDNALEFANTLTFTTQFAAPSQHRIGLMGFGMTESYPTNCITAGSYLAASGYIPFP
jgi:hypothetical protein